MSFLTSISFCLKRFTGSRFSHVNADPMQYFEKP